MEENWANRIGWLLWLLGLAMLGNALWMLAGPMHWYTELPAAVPDTGPFNPHFVRDVGCAFLAAGVALVWAGYDTRRRFPLTVTASLFVAGHALVHVYDTARGALGHDHWWLDAPAVYLPALVLGAVSFALYRLEPIPR